MQKKLVLDMSNDLLLALLKENKLVDGDKELAEDLAEYILEDEKRYISQYNANEVLFRQDDRDQCLFFILRGRIRIERNGKLLATRGSRSFLGEMNPIEPSSGKRTATALAIEETLVAKIEGKTLWDLSFNYPNIWRVIARENAERIRQLLEVNYQKDVDLEKPAVFLVHGQNEISKNKVVTFLGKLGFLPIVLQEQAKRGKTIIEAIEDCTGVGFGIVLYTPCDIGGRGRIPRPIYPGLDKM